MSVEERNQAAELLAAFWQLDADGKAKALTYVNAYQDGKAAALRQIAKEAISKCPSSTSSETPTTA